MEKTLGEFIRELRISKAMPLRKLAALLDIDQSTLSKIERNERKVSKGMIPKISGIFEINYKELQIRFLSENLIQYLQEEDYSIEALRVAEKRIKYQKS